MVIGRAEALHSWHARTAMSQVPAIAEIEQKPNKMNSEGSPAARETVRKVSRYLWTVATGTNGRFQQLNIADLPAEVFRTILLHVGDVWQLGAVCSAWRNPVEEVLLLHRARIPKPERVISYLAHL